MLLGYIRSSILLLIGDLVMSMGYGASCRLISMDDEWYAYEYTSYNIDLDNYKEAMNNYDGILLISKDFFPNPTIIKKKMRKSNGKKVWIEKKKYPEVDCWEFCRCGKIIVENSSHCWSLSEEGIDNHALNLLFSLNIEYQKTGIVPEKFGIFS